MPEETEVTTEPKQEPTAQKPSTQADGGPMTSRELRDGGIDLNTVDWMQKWNGFIGRYRQEKSQWGTEKGERDSKITSLEAELTALRAQMEDATSKVGQVEELQAQLTTATEEATARQSLLNKQSLLLEYPRLLAAKDDDGKNPFTELVLSSTLSPDDLKKQVEGMEAMLSKSNGQSAVDGSAPPPASPPSAEPAGSAALRAKALMWDEKIIDTNRTDLEAISESAKAWERVREAEAREKEGV